MVEVTQAAVPSAAEIDAFKLALIRTLTAQRNEAMTGVADAQAQIQVQAAIIREQTGQITALKEQVAALETANKTTPAAGVTPGSRHGRLTQVVKIKPDEAVLDPLPVVSVGGVGTQEDVPVDAVYPKPPTVAPHPVDRKLPW